MGRAAVAPSTRSTSSTRASTRRSGRAPRRGDLDHVDYRAARPRYHAAWGFTSLNERIVRLSFPESLSVVGLRERLLVYRILSHTLLHIRFSFFGWSFKRPLPGAFRSRSSNFHFSCSR